jgi:Tol biopolymer transport system component
MSDLAISSMLSFDPFLVFEYAGAGVLAAVGMLLLIALSCAVVEECGRRRKGRRTVSVWRLAVMVPLLAWPMGLSAQTPHTAHSTTHALPAISPAQDSGGTVTRRVWADAELYGISPDGRLAVFMDWAADRLAVRDLESGSIRHLTPRADGFSDGAAFSPDGRFVAYSWYDTPEPGYYKLGVVDVEGRSPRLVYRDRTTKWIDVGDWSPDGRYVVIARSVESGDATELVLVRAADGEARLLKSFPNPSPGTGPSGMSFSPDGRYIAYHRSADDPENHDVYVLNISTGEERVLIGAPSDDRLLGWAPDGRHVLFESNRSGTPGAWLLPVADGRADGAPRLVKPDMWRASGVGFARDGRYFYKVTTARNDVYVVNFDPASGSVVGSPTAITARARFSSSGTQWSPDGRYLAYRRERDQSSPTDRIAVQSLETGDVKEFNFGLSGWMGVHSWSADGRSLVIWVSNPGDRDHRYALYRLDVQTGRRERLPDPLPSIPLQYPLPAADSGVLVYMLSEENDSSQAAFRIVRYQLATGDTTTLFRTPFGAWGQIMGPSLSPDGRTVAFGCAPSVGTAASSIVLLPVNGGPPRRLPIPNRGFMSWMPDGRALLFQRLVSAPPPRWEVWYVDLATAEPHAIGLTTRGTRPGFQVRPDGRQIAYTSGRDGTELWVMENFLSDGGSQ